MLFKEHIAKFTISTTCIHVVDSMLKDELGLDFSRPPSFIEVLIGLNMLYVIRSYRTLRLEMHDVKKRQ
jgi:hypothetical protein